MKLIVRKQPQTKNVPLMELHATLIQPENKSFITHGKSAKMEFLAFWKNTKVWDPVIKAALIINSTRIIIQLEKIYSNQLG